MAGSKQINIQLIPMLIFEGISIVSTVNKQISMIFVFKNVAVFGYFKQVL